MKLKKLFALALAVCMMALAVPAAFAASLTLDYGTTPTNPVVEVPTPVVYNTRTTSRASKVDAAGLITSKEASYDSVSNSATIKIEAYTIGDADTETKPVPTDIVLLLDESKSMETSAYEYKPITFTENESNMNKSATYYVLVNGSYVAVKYCSAFHLFQTFGDGWYTGTHWGFHWGSYYAPKKQSYSWWDQQKDNTYNVTRVQFYERTAVNETKIELLKAEAIDFVGKIEQDAATKDVAHRVSVVNFSSSATVEIGLVDDIRNNLGAVTDTTNSTVIGAINSLSLTNNATNISDALAKAQTALNSSSSDRNKVVVLFTNYGGYSTDVVDENSVGAINDAISAAATLKAKAVGADVYAIGMMEQADPTLDVLDSNIDSNGNTYEKSVLINRMMQYVSSNFPSAASLTSPGSKASSNYYVAASDAESLENIFGKILKSVQEQVTTTELSLDATTQIIDNIMPQFGTPTSVTFESYNCKSYEKGKDPTWYTENHGASGASYSFNDETGTVTVTGFNFDNYYLTDEAKTGDAYKDAPNGRKLVIKIVVPVEAGFLGGTGVYTNDELSGIYKADKTLVEHFDRPTVDIPVKAVTPVVNPQTIYLSGSVADATKLYTANTYTWEDEYVTITYKVSEGTTEKTGALAPTGCVDYTVTCTVDGGTYTDGSENKAETKQIATVHVVKPVVSNADAVIYAGNTIDLTSCMIEGTNWVCEHTGDAQKSLPAYQVVGETRTRILGVPALTHTFNGESTSTVNLKACTPYTVETSVGGNVVKPVNDDATFKVHVLYPSFSGIDKTIYLGNETSLEKTDVSWACKCAGDEQKTTATQGGKNNEAYGFAVTGNVSPADCQSYTLTYSVNGETFTDETWIHVRKPVFEINSVADYLGNTVTVSDLLNGNVGWDDGCEHNDVTHNRVGDKPTDITFVVKQQNEQGKLVKVESVKPNNCKLDYVAMIKINGRTFENETKTFAIHVIKPIVTAKDAVIKMGVQAPETGEIKWNAQETNSILTRSINYFCDCSSNNAHTSTHGAEPKLGLDHSGEEYPTSCNVNAHRATAVITPVGGTAEIYEGIYHDYTVHVQEPIVTGTEDTIYQGQEYNLASEVEWSDCAHANQSGWDTSKMVVVDTDPESKTTYKANGVGDDVTQANYDTCTNYTVFYQLTKPAEQPTVTGEFTVHVLIPTFTVETQDLWADLGTNVTLFRAAATDVDAVKSCGSSWIYSGANCGHQNPPAAADLPADAPDVAVTKVAFNEGEAAAIEEQDVSVTANAVTYTVNRKTYTAGNDRLTGSLTAKLHANTFVLKVKNTSAQNGIFTLKQGNTELYDVAVPGNSDTTTIAGLYCTKPYNLDETTGNAWSWRYNTAVKSNEAVHAKPGVVATENCNAVVEVTVNYGDTQDNAKWLADEDCVVNKATTQAATINPTLSVKKKDEEVTNV